MPKGGFQAALFYGPTMFDIECRDTIVAVATPPGEGGVAIVRLSGHQAEQILQQHFQGASYPLPSHQLNYGHFIDRQGAMVDEVMVVLMHPPRSFTRELVAEIHCHGSRIVQQRIVDELQRSGARLAQPGEFTFRAFIHGRIDLTQAEAVIELIHARSDQARKIAMDQLEGRLGHSLTQLNHQLADLLALVESWIDFSEEELDLPSPSELQQLAKQILDPLDRLIASYDSGRAYIDGIAVLLLGKPNVGKSSLLNSLIEEERAIVTDIPGTTRDLIEEGFSLQGLPLKLIDAAGVRDTDDPIETIGVERTRGKAQQADLIVLVVDGSQPLSDDDFKTLDLLDQQRVIVVSNKNDLGTQPLPAEFSAYPTVTVSTKTGEGLPLLRQQIVDLFPLPEAGEGIESVILTEQRQWHSARQARQALQQFYDAVSAETPYELLAVDLRTALDYLAEITGETTPDTILGRIFERFCVGK